MAQTYRGRIEGTVEFFNNGKPYGRIRGVDRQLYHVGMSHIGPHGTGFKSLQKGEAVTFEPTPNDRPGALPEAKRVMRSVKMPELASNLGTPTNPIGTVKLAISVDGEISMPHRDADLRDYSCEDVKAIYIGHPGSVREETLIGVDFPDSSKDGVELVPVDDNGGVLRHGQWVYDFPKGGFILVTKISGESCEVITKKIALRRQDSVSVVDKRDHGEWVVTQNSYRLKLEIPSDYADEDDLEAKLEIQIPDPYGWAKKKRAASAKKFARGIAHAIIRASQRGLGQTTAEPLNKPFQALAKTA